VRATWLPDVLRAAGLTVVEVPGWKGRGKELTAINGVVAHHTATGTNWTDARVDALLRDGRADLPGPLAQLGLRRSGAFVLVADGRANHNGYGQWGNASIGIEAYNAGDGIDPWPAAQLDAYQRGAAAILAHLGLGADRVLAHRETDPKRKPDPRGIDMVAFRARVAHHIAHPAGTPTGPSTTTEDAMTDADRKLLAQAVAEAQAAGLRAAHCEQLLAEVLAALNVPASDGKRPYPVRTIEALTRIEAHLGSNG